MAQLVTMGAATRCSFGLSPSALNVLPTNQCLAGSLPAATVMDQIPFVNILPFGLCTSILNPAVASATAAALGVLTPMPCTPVISGSWFPGSPTVKIAGKSALTSLSTCLCEYRGVITITTPGQATVTAP